MREKKMMRCLLALLLVLALAVPLAAFAADPTEATYIFDGAGLFTEEQYRNLQEQAMSVSNYSQCGVYFVAVDDFSNYSGYGDMLTAAEDIYLTNGFGIGEERNGILLILSMAEREYALIAYGDFGNMAFTDYGKDVMSEHFLDDFADNHWYGGVLDYLLDCEQMLDLAMAGTPMDVQTQGTSQGTIQNRPLFMAVPMALLPAAALALVICLVLKRQMKTARRQTDAFEYVVGNSVDFRVRQDIFTHVTRSRRRINTNNGPKPGGGTTVRSSGFSGKSGKF